MRTLLLLHGAPGSGKSTFVHENKLEPYTLCADDFRTMIADPVLNENGDFCITQENDHDAWTLLFNALEKRMQRGDFTVIDATNCSPKMISHYKPYAEKYRYQVYMLDFDPGLDDLLRRNKLRDEYKRVPEDAVKRMYAMYQSVPTQKYCKKINSLSEIENYFTADYREYNRVVVFGDVHGCFTALMDALADISPDGKAELDPNTRYIFAGDMLDRGIQNREVLDWMIENYHRQNVTFVMGNHDQHLLNWAFDTFPTDKNGKKRIPREFMAGTIPDILAPCMASDENGVNKLHPGKVEVLKSMVRDLTRRFVQCNAFTFAGQKYFVCHGGLTALPKMTYIPAIQMTKGVGNYQYHVDETWEKSYAEGRTQGFIQIHGHRKDAALPDTYHGTEHSICLEGSVERGGNLVFCEITNGGLKIHEVKNTIFRAEECTDAAKEGCDSASGDALESLRKAANAGIRDTRNAETNKILRDPNVRAKILPDHNLMSLGFSDKAFYQRKWNENTARARGLFVDQESGDIKMRSYNKFFNLYELPETSPAALSKHLSFPIKAYYKANGFLGIMSVIDGDIVLASKSTTQGPFAEMFREIWATLAPEEKSALKNAAEKHHCSFTFEVCHVGDKHIIDFDQNHLWLLDAIPNQYDIGGADINEQFSEEVKSEIPLVSGVMRKKLLLKTFDSMDQVIAYAKEHHHDRNIEGIVLQDQNGYMFKVKFHYYTTIKKLRAALQFAQKTYSTGIPWGRFQDERTVKFIAFFMKKPFDEWKDIHIIDAVKMYEQETGTLLMDRT